MGSGVGSGLALGIGSGVSSGVGSGSALGITVSELSVGSRYPLQTDWQGISPRETVVGHDNLWDHGLRGAADAPECQFGQEFVVGFGPLAFNGPQTSDLDITLTLKVKHFRNRTSSP
jgi:hypothetical protein